MRNAEHLSCIFQKSEKIRNIARVSSRESSRGYRTHRRSWHRGAEKINEHEMIKTPILLTPIGVIAPIGVVAPGAITPMKIPLWIKTHATMEVARFGFFFSGW